MRAVIQRVCKASVSIDGEIISKIAKGLLVLLCIEKNDGAQDADYIKKKLLGLRIFPNTEGKFDLSVSQTGGEILLVSQFTLAGDARHGMRPDFSNAARPEEAVPMYERMICELSQAVPVKCGVFGADMQIELINDGPVTVMLDSRKTF